MENKKKAIVVSVMGRLVKKTPSRHYWLYDGTKWVRIGLTRIAALPPKIAVSETAAGFEEKILTRQEFETF